ncbi:MAG: hypothetical protein MK141_14135 [Pseudoxanthomonas sp.]|uniref:hypothetical protein n=1 Tax=Pseudoxanthomonas sp. TaxID=1871049 RepID=UPI00258BD93B|nr:hypothetical protein [Pseudoxanthomonas sp.]MCH2092698.1 hypothetical protein [Pseudoxanthomonas sp.]
MPMHQQSSTTHGRAAGIHAQRPHIRQVQHVLPDELFMLDDNESVFALAKHEGIPQDGAVRWAVCVATNGAQENVGTLREVRAVSLVRLVAQTRAPQYQEL